MNVTSGCGGCGCVYIGAGAGAGVCVLNPLLYAWGVK